MLPTDFCVIPKHIVLAHSNDLFKKNSVFQGNVTVLMDNPPDGEFVYIVTVITGWLRGNYLCSQ